MKRIARLSLSIFIILLAANAYSRRKVLAKHPLNPTSYAYTASLTDVRNTILNVFGEHYYHSLELEYPGKKILYSDSAKKIFAEAGNANDFYLFDNGMWICDLHDINGKAYHYFADFHIHLADSVGVKTVVTINTINPRIITGEKLLPSFPHFGSNPKYQQVAPTTIEEYELLLIIGDSLHVRKTMPPIIY